MFGSITLLTGLYAAATSRASWMRLSGGRRAGGIVLASGLVVTIVGAALLPPVEEADLAAAASSEQDIIAASPTSTPTPSATKTAKPTTTPKPTPSPSPAKTADAAPLDPDEVPVVTTDGVEAPQGQPEYGVKALALLETLSIKGRAPKTGYDRDQFGTAWSDVDRNGCDTRNDMLKRDLNEETFRAGTGNCLVLTGILDDPYTASSIDFLRGQKTSWKVQIDHVVALSDAWQKGAQQLSAGQRLAFANDPINLQATDGPTNSSKGAGDAATWLPPNNSFRCEYVARQISVKSTYSLWVTQAEHDAMARILSNCADIMVPTNQKSPEPVPEPVAPAPPPPAPAAPAEPAPVVPVVPIVPVAPVVPPPPPPAAPPAAVFYKNCTAARNAGAAPVRLGDAGYARHLDRDGDGVGCE